MTIRKKEGIGNKEDKVTSAPKSSADSLILRAGELQPPAVCPVLSQVSLTRPLVPLLLSSGSALMMERRNTLDGRGERAWGAIADWS